MSMTKLVVMHHLLDPDDRPGLERWFWKHHCPEVLAQAPWMTRYVLYRAQPAPSGAEAYGAINYRVHENWVWGPDQRRGVRGLLSMTPEPAAMEVLAFSVPAEPTEDFLGADLRPDDKSVLRWVCAFRYPDGVEEEKGEDWYLNVHVPEVCRQPGLIRFFSHKAQAGVRPAISKSNAQRPFMARVSPLMGKRWHRISELWYENDSGWKESVLKAPPAYTPPPWTGHGAYPFLVPGQEFVSAFLLERPDEDLMQTCRPRHF